MTGDSKDTKEFHEELFEIEDELMDWIQTSEDREEERKAFLAFCEKRGIK